ncbi:hypothetical protein BJX63DRAFT_405846 [Aspergillus granulosus]|uniref:Hydrophobin n=1 Tax=Aspergillus granulosus TaxID=176169 RepID=A0ABR4H1U3_9EURO
MKFLALATLFAAVALAMPADHHGSEGDSGSEGHNDSQPGYACGQAQAACCPDLNREDITREQEGALLDLLGNSDIAPNLLGGYRGCSSLVSLQNTVGGQCNNHVACCNAGDTELNGLVNIAIPCLPINLL